MNPDKICYGCFQEKGEGSICPHCGFDAQATQPYLALPLGTILNGRYMTGKVLGMGGFGITYLGYDLTLQIRVAIKEYMPSSIATRHADRYGVTLSGLSEQDYRYGMERFLDEARILAKLQNTPNIVSVQNYFKENNTAYFVMEYVDGMSLKAYLEAQGGKIPYTQALTILQPIMEALAQVHAMNLLHRDISPDNIFITTRGESRLLDFGAARFALGDEKSVSVILKHGYAPEEQYSSHGNQGPWTDVYAMGATLYRGLPGTMPPDSVERLRQDTLKLPSELGVHVPKYVEQALGKALAVHAADRFANMEAFIQALSGRPSVQERVAAGVSERTQAARSPPGCKRIRRAGVLQKAGRMSRKAYRLSCNFCKAAAKAGSSNKRAKSASAWTPLRSSLRYSREAVAGSSRRRAGTPGENRSWSRVGNGAVSASTYRAKQAAASLKRPCSKWRAISRPSPTSGSPKALATAW